MNRIVTLNNWGGVEATFLTALCACDLRFGLCLALPALPKFLDVKNYNLEINYKQFALSALSFLGDGADYCVGDSRLADAMICPHSR